MHEETQKVLEMVADGAITAEQAEQLLDAMHGPEAEQTTLLSSVINGDKPVTVLPPKPDWARFWIYPTVVGLFIASLGLGYTILVFSGGIHWAWIFLTLFALFGGGVLVVVGWLMKTSNWLHIRIQDDGDRVMISLPLPLGWIGWAVKIARPFVPQLADIATDELLEALAETSPEGVFQIEVQESESEYVQIYYG